jgi:regulatory protein
MERRSPRDDLARLLSRRALSEAELRARLAGRGHAPEAVEEALAEARSRGYVDDLALARDLLAASSARRLRGRERLIAELESRGIPGETARRAWEALVQEGEVAPEGVLAEAVARRVRAEGGTLSGRAAGRVYNALLRAGHDPDAIRAALAPHVRHGDDDDLP